MASVTVNLTGYTDQPTFDLIQWSDTASLGSLFSLDGGNQTLSQATQLHTDDGAVAISLIGTNDRFTVEFEATGRIIFESSDGETLEVTIGNADMSEPYRWIPSNSAEVITFAQHIRGLTDNSISLTFTDDPAATAPEAPAAPTLTVLSTSSIRAVGVEPDDNGADIDNYDWRYRETAGTPPWINRLNQTNLTQSFGGLDAGTEYEFQV